MSGSGRSLGKTLSATGRSSVPAPPPTAPDPDLVGVANRGFDSEVEPGVVQCAPETIGRTQPLPDDDLFRRFVVRDEERPG